MLMRELSVLPLSLLSLAVLTSACTPKFNRAPQSAVALDHAVANAPAPSTPQAPWVGAPGVDGGGGGRSVTANFKLSKVTLGGAAPGIIGTAPGVRLKGGAKLGP